MRMLRRVLVRLGPLGTGLAFVCELLQRRENVARFGAAAVVGVDVDELDHVVGVDDQDGRHRQDGAAVVAVQGDLLLTQIRRGPQPSALRAGRCPIRDHRRADGALIPRIGA